MGQLLSKGGQITSIGGRLLSDDNGASCCDCGAFPCQVQCVGCPTAISVVVAGFSASYDADGLACPGVDVVFPPLQVQVVDGCGWRAFGGNSEDVAGVGCGGANGFWLGDIGCVFTIEGPAWFFDLQFHLQCDAPPNFNSFVQIRKELPHNSICPTPLFGSWSLPGGVDSVVVLGDNLEACGQHTGGVGGTVIVG